MFVEPAPDQGPVLVTIEYSIDPNKSADFLEAIYKYQRIRRRDGASHWGIFYDSGKFLAGIWRIFWSIPGGNTAGGMHGRFTLADRKLEERVNSFSVDPVRVRHFIHAEKNETGLSGEPSDQQRLEKSKSSSINDS